MLTYRVVRWAKDNDGPESDAPCVWSHGTDREAIEADADIEQIDEFDIRNGKYRYGVMDSSGTLVYRSERGLPEGK
jgi:hypothetical protein